MASTLRVRGSLFKVLCQKNRGIQSIPSLLSLNSCRRILTYQQIPRAPYMPILGSLPYFLKAGGQTYLHKYVDKHHKTLGPIFLDKLSGNDFLFVSDPTANIKVYSYEGRYPEHFVLESWKLFLQETGRKRGLYFMDGEEWHKTRSVLNKEMLVPKSMTNHVQGVSDVCKDLMDVWKVKPPNNLEYQIYCWTIECVGDVTMGKRLGFLEKLKHHDQKNLKHVQEDQFVRAIYDIFSESANLYSWPAKLAKNLKLKSWKKFYSAVQTALDYGENYVQEGIRDCKGNPSEKMKQSILYKVLNEKSMQEDTITHVFTDLFLASSDTTSYTACWILYLLGKNPKVAEEARKEIFRILEEEKTLILDTISKIRYVKGIIKEALRLYPIAAFLTRKLAIETDLYGYSVPAGTMVISSLFSMGRDSVNFADPEAFRPERWFKLKKMEMCKENQTAHVSQAYIPWGIGGRSCVGRRVAELELSLLIIEALKAFEWTVDEEIEPILRMTNYGANEDKRKFNNFAYHVLEFLCSESIYIFSSVRKDITNISVGNI